MESSADFNLLLGVLALHLGFVDRDGLVRAMHGWALEKDKPFSDFLVEKAGLSESQRAKLVPLVHEHLKLDGNATSDFLTSIGPPSSGEPGPTVDTSLESLHSTNRENDPPQTVTYELQPASPSQRFQDIRYLNRGGLGEIWEAKDTQLDRVVAVKKIRDEFSDDEYKCARFLFEAQITGGLEHPNIVPIYAGEKEDTGRPFYAMKLVYGDSLDTAISALHADPPPSHESLRDLVRRLIDVCYAVEYAHSKGVVHRDIKPANIMLGQYNETFLVDWGLAKRVTETPAFDETSGIVGTPAYMSPEQLDVSNPHNDPRIDVYGLGATLYAILTGKHPFSDDDLDLQRLSLDPTTYRTPWQRGIHPAPIVTPGIDASLRAVCTTAIAEKASDRYASAREFAEDMQRWIDDDPVSVRKESTSERLSRWTRKHRTLMLSTAVAALVVMLSLSASLFLVSQANIQANRNKEQAKNSYAIAKSAIDSWVTGPADELRDWGDPAIQALRSQLLELAVAAYDRLTMAEADEPMLVLEQARAHLRLADIKRDEADYEASAQSYQRSIEILERIEKHEEVRQLASIEKSNVLTRLGSLESRTGSQTNGETTLRTAIENLKQLQPDASLVSIYRAAYANGLLQYGLCLNRQGKTQDAIARHAEAVGLLKNTLEIGDDVSLQLQNILKAREALVLSLLSQRDAEMAESLTGTILESASQLRASQQSAASSELYALALALTGMSRELSGRTHEASKFHARAASVFTELMEDSPLVFRYRREAAVAKFNHGRILQRLKQSRKAHVELTMAMQWFDELVDDFPRIDSLRFDQANCASELASAKISLIPIRSDDASAPQHDLVTSVEELLQLAAEGFGSLVDQNDVAGSANAIEGAALTLAIRARLDNALGRHIPARHLDAVAALEQSKSLIETLVNATGPQQPYLVHLAMFCHRLGQLHSDSDEAKATQYFDEATAYWDQAESLGDSPDVLHEFAWTLLEQPSASRQDFQRAQDLVQRAIAIQPKNPNFHCTLGVALYRLGDPQQAIAEIELSTRLRDDIATAREAYWLAIAKNSSEEFQNGERWREENCPGNLNLWRLRERALGSLGDNGKLPSD